MRRLENLKIGIKFKPKNRFRFNNILENKITDFEDIFRKNNKKKANKNNCFDEDFNTWVNNLDEYIKSSSCNIYSLKKIRAIEKSENWLLFKPYLFYSIDSIDFFKSLLYSSTSGS